MTATVTRPQVRRTAENAGSPIVDAWVARYATEPAPDNFPIGYFVRQEDGDKERIANAVYQDEASPLFFEPAIVCTEEGAWF